MRKQKITRQVLEEGFTVDGDNVYNLYEKPNPKTTLASRIQTQIESKSKRNNQTQRKTTRRKTTSV
jgi:hypothetical protein